MCVCGDCPLPSAQRKYMMNEGSGGSTMTDNVTCSVVSTFMNSKKQFFPHTSCPPPPTTRWCIPQSLCICTHKSWRKVQKAYEVTFSLGAHESSESIWGNIFPSLTKYFPWLRCNVHLHCSGTYEWGGGDWKQRMCKPTGFTSRNSWKWCLFMNQDLVWFGKNRLKAKS
jgi:hypothetical protein